MPPVAPSTACTGPDALIATQSQSIKKALDILDTKNFHLCRVIVTVIAVVKTGLHNYVFNIIKTRLLGGGGGISAALEKVRQLHETRLRPRVATNRILN